MTVVRTFTTRVASVSEEFDKRNYRVGTDGRWTHDLVSLGWFVRFEDSWEKVGFGRERPEDVAVGDVFEVSMRKVEVT